MTPASIPVDLRNPGQVFACLGLMEMTEILSGPCMVRFSYANNETECRFELDAPEGCIKKAIRFLARCEIIAIAPRPEPGGKSLSTAKWQVETLTVDGPFFPSPTPNSPAPLPIRLSCEGVEIPVEHWLDNPRSGRDNVKFWAGSGGYPGAALARDAISLLSVLDDPALSRTALDPFAFSAPMSSSFNFDWRRSYIPLDAGFSPNDQPSIDMVGFPLVELLAAAGLQNARPSRLAPKNKLAYRYHVSNSWLPPCLVRAVLGSDATGFPVRGFRMYLGWPGKENQARCIINAEEE
jgi:CRISPR-associated protein Csx14